MRSVMLLALVGLAGCGSITLPTAARFEDGTALTGTATAAVSGGTFQLSQPGGTLSCNGTYDALDTSPTITIPVTCSDGRYGSAVITRARDGMSGTGSFITSDGKRGVVAFGNNAGTILNSSYPSYAAASPSYSSSRVYTGNCPTPDSLDAAGRRCGARSAASRAGGYDGYGSWAPSYNRSYSSYGGGSTFVRGYYRRNGTYVRSHYRRR